MVSGLLLGREGKYYVISNPQGWMNLWVGDQHKTNLYIDIFLSSGDAMETGDWRLESDERERERESIR